MSNSTRKSRLIKKRKFELKKVSFWLFFQQLKEAKRRYENLLALSRSYTNHFLNLLHTQRALSSWKYSSLIREKKADLHLRWHISRTETQIFSSLRWIRLQCWNTNALSSSRWSSTKCFELFYVNTRYTLQ